MSPLTTQINVISDSLFSGYALLWESFSRHIQIGDPNQMIGLTIAHTFFVKESAASQPFVATADVATVVNARRNKFGLFITGRWSPTATDPRLIKLLQSPATRGVLHLTPDYRSQSDLQIVRFSVYVPPQETQILAGATAPVSAQTPTVDAAAASQSDSDSRPERDSPDQ